MRTPKQLYAQRTEMYKCELENCPTCETPLVACDYSSGHKSVQTLEAILQIAYRPKYCPKGDCLGHRIKWKSAKWQQLAPLYCSYGYDVIAWLGWQRQSYYQPFDRIHRAISDRVKISESQVRHLYYQRYLPLLACQERNHLGKLLEVSNQSGLILSLDGLAPEGGEPQLWVVRELQTGLTLRSGWLSCQDQSTFEQYLKPIADLNLKVVAILSDKQRGLLPAVESVFPQVKHAFCQAHYFNNLAKPVAEADESLKVTLRHLVREEVGDLIRGEPVLNQGVLTITGLIPSPLADEQSPEFPGLDPKGIDNPLSASLADEQSPEFPGLDPKGIDNPLNSRLAIDQSQEESLPPELSQEVSQQRQAIVEALLRRVRYVLTLKGRPPFRLAGIEMFQQLSQLLDVLETLLVHAWDERLVRLKQALTLALQLLAPYYKPLLEVAHWLNHISELLDPDGKPPRTGHEVRQQLFAYLDQVVHYSRGDPILAEFAEKIYKTTENYERGLFHTYDVPGLPRTNNDRESEFRELSRRLLITTGQKGATRRILHRSGAWELIPRPSSLAETISALSKVDQDAFVKERKRVRTHRNRFQLHTRSAKLAKRQLRKLQERWIQLAPKIASG
jgi:hypothetical protein